jgi:hypothetical protein
MFIYLSNNCTVLRGDVQYRSSAGSFVQECTVISLHASSKHGISDPGNDGHLLRLTVLPSDMTYEPADTLSKQPTELLEMLLTLLASAHITTLWGIITVHIFIDIHRFLVYLTTSSAYIGYSASNDGLNK